MGVLNCFFAGGGGWEICPSKKLPGVLPRGGWSGLELTDTLQTCKIIDSVVEITMKTS